MSSFVGVWLEDSLPRGVSAPDFGLGMRGWRGFTLFDILAEVRSNGHGASVDFRGCFHGLPVIRLSLGKLSVNLLQVVKRTNTPLKSST